MSELLVEVTRGGRVESAHNGEVAVCDGAGNVIAHAGDPDRETYLRSSSKPIQALNVILSGAADRFGFGNYELSIMCASHFAEPFHRAAVATVLEKAGIALEYLKSPGHPSINSERMKEQIAEGHVIDNLDSNCSGKHSGMLAACKARGYQLVGYMEPDHPVQQDILRILEEVCVVPEGGIPTAEDGCGVPVHWMSMKAMARGYARLSTPGSMRDELKVAANRIIHAINAHPENLDGTGGFNSALVRATGGRLIAKTGAEGVYCVGLVGMDRGISVKIDDGIGSRRAVAPVVLSALEQIGFFEAGMPEELKKFASAPVKNFHGHVVGEVRPVFKLKQN